jgi:hypothetical protein
MNAAIADTSYDHALVDFVFICDMGNDIRATWSVAAAAPSVFAAARAEFRAARLILVPCFWGNAVDNNWGARIASISDRVQEATNAGLPYSLEIVSDSWTWMGDATTWMKPGEVHYNAAGYSRVVEFMNRFMLGNRTRYDYGAKFIGVNNTDNLDADHAYWRISRIGDVAHMEGNFRAKQALGYDWNMGQLEYGTWPIDTVYAPVVNLDNRTLCDIAIFNGESGSGGLVRSFGNMPAGNYSVQASWRTY